MFLYLVLVVFLAVLLLKRQYSYWTRLGVYQIKPSFPFGNFKDEILGRKPFFCRYKSAYAELKALKVKHGGMYIFTKPTYIPMDVDVIKKILISDFSHFYGHGTYQHDNDTLSRHLFNLEGEQWRTCRAKLSPAFTSGKMKIIFETMLKMTDGLENLVGKYVDTKEPMDIKELCARFTTDIISSVGFGIDSHCLIDGENDIRRYGKKMLSPRIIRVLAFLFAPGWLLGPLRFKTIDDDVAEFFTSALQRVIRYREETGETRKDLMHYMLEMKKNSTLTENELIANFVSFYAAGFETSSTTMAFALLELSQHDDIQSRLRDEISAVLDKYEGKMCYEAIMNMNYLDMVINETLRLHPPGPIIARACNKDYPVPGTDLVLKKGTQVNIPVWGFQTDADYYPNPEQFNPEHFTAEKIASRPVATFMPFGEGPRMCIGRRFGLMQTKVGLISLLRKFNFTLNEKTHIPIQYQIGGFVLAVKDEVWVNCTKI